MSLEIPPQQNTPQNNVTETTSATPESTLTSTSISSIEIKIEPLVDLVESKSVENYIKNNTTFVTNVVDTSPNNEINKSTFVTDVTIATTAITATATPIDTASTTATNTTTTHTTQNNWKRGRPNDQNNANNSNQNNPRKKQKSNNSNDNNKNNKLNQKNTKGMPRFRNSEVFLRINYTEQVSAYLESLAYKTVIDSTNSAILPPRDQLQIQQQKQKQQKQKQHNQEYQRQSNAESHQSNHQYNHQNNHQNAAATTMATSTDNTNNTDNADNTNTNTNTIATTTHLTPQDSYDYAGKLLNLSKFHNMTMRRIAKKHVIRLGPGIKHGYCKSCFSPINFCTRETVRSIQKRKQSVLFANVLCNRCGFKNKRIYGGITEDKDDAVMKKEDGNEKEAENENENEKENEKEKESKEEIKKTAPVTTITTKETQEDQHSQDINQDTTTDINQEIKTEEKATTNEGTTLNNIDNIETQKPGTIITATTNTAEIESDMIEDNSK